MLSLDGEELRKPPQSFSSSASNVLSNTLREKEIKASAFYYIYVPLFPPYFPLIKYVFN